MRARRAPAPLARSANGAAGRPAGRRVPRTATRHVPRNADRRVPRNATPAPHAAPVDVLRELFLDRLGDEQRAQLRAAWETVLPGSATVDDATWAARRRAPLTGGALPRSGLLNAG